MIFQGVAMIFLPAPKKNKGAQSLGHPNHVFRLTSVVPRRYWRAKGMGSVGNEEEQRQGMWMKGCKVRQIYGLNHD